MIYGLLCCYYYKFKGPRSGSDEASKQYRSQNEVEKAMGPRNKLAKITGGFLSIFQLLQTKRWHSWTQGRKQGAVGAKNPP